MTIPEVLEELGIEMAPDGHHHQTEGWTNIDCPWCSPGAGAFRLGIADNGITNCWQCGPQRLWTSLAEASSKPLREIGVLCAGLGGDRPAERTLERQGRLVIPPGVDIMMDAHRKYLKRRKLDPEGMERLWGVQGIGPEGGRLAWRLFIPIRREFETVSWTTRAIGDTRLRYWTAKPEQEKISNRKILYGAELARNAIVICEGPIDAWSIGPGAVATLGLGFSQSQVRLMSKYAVRVVSFDREPAAQRRAKELCRELEPFDGDTYHVVLESNKDANACLLTRSGRKEIRSLRSRFLR